MENNIIKYTVGKSICRDLCISVQDGVVEVKAPWYFSKERIREAVEAKKNWILEKIKEHNTAKQNIIKRSIKIFDKNYGFKLIYKNIQIINCNIYKNSTIEIELPVKYKEIDDKVMMDLLINKMYKKIAEKEIEEIMEKTRIKLGFAPEDYKIEALDNCMAMCTNDKQIIINPNIIKYSKNIIEYIILHEYCHLKYKSHGKRFYEMIKKYSTNYIELDKMLKNVNY